MYNFFAADFRFVTILRKLSTPKPPIDCVCTIYLPSKNNLIHDTHISRRIHTKFLKMWQLDANRILLWKILSGKWLNRSLSHFKWIDTGAKETKENDVYAQMMVVTGYTIYGYIYDLGKKLQTMLNRDNEVWYIYILYGMMGFVYTHMVRLKWNENININTERLIYL